MAEQPAPLLTARHKDGSLIYPMRPGDPERRPVKSSYQYKDHVFVIIETKRNFRASVLINGKSLMGKHRKRDFWARRSRAKMAAKSFINSLLRFPDWREKLLAA